MHCLGHKDIVEFLLQKDAIANAAGNYGNTALIWAAVAGPKESIVSLVEKGGANIHHTNREGYTALLYGSKHGIMNMKL